MANLAMKPDSGGSPASNRAQKMKPPPRMAIVPGMTTPVSSSSSSMAPTYSSSNTGSAMPAILSSSSALRSTGSVAKIVKLEHAWRRLDGRNDDGFQVAPLDRMSTRLNSSH